MKIYSFVRMVWDKELKRYVTVEVVSREYSGPLARCWGDPGEADEGGNYGGGGYGGYEEEGFGALDFGGYGGYEEEGFGALDFGGDPNAQAAAAGMAGPGFGSISDPGTSTSFGWNEIKEALQVATLALGFTGSLPVALGTGLLYGGYQAAKSGAFGAFDTRTMGPADPNDRTSRGDGTDQVQNEPALGYAANIPVPSVDSDEVLKREAADKSKKLEDEARKRVGYLSMRVTDPFSIYQPLQVARPQLTGAMV